MFVAEKSATTFGDLPDCLCRALGSYFMGYFYLFILPLMLQGSEFHYDDVIMDTIASQITSLTIVYSIVYSGTDQRKHQSSASLAFVRWIHRQKGQ